MSKYGKAILKLFWSLYFQSLGTQGLHQSFSIGGDFTPQSTSKCWRHFQLPQLGVLLASSGYRPELRPTTILQCTGKPPQQRIIWPQMSIVPLLRNPRRNPIIFYIVDTIEHNTLQTPIPKHHQNLITYSHSFNKYLSSNH